MYSKTCLHLCFIQEYWNIGEQLFLWLQKWVKSLSSFKKHFLNLKSSKFCTLLHNRSHSSKPSSYQCAGSANELRSFNARHDINLGACHHCGHSLSSFQKLAPPPLGLRLYILPYSAVTVNVSVVGTLEWQKTSCVDLLQM